MRCCGLVMWVACRWALVCIVVVCNALVWYCGLHCVVLPYGISRRVLMCVGVCHYVADVCVVRGLRLRGYVICVVMMYNDMYVVWCIVMSCAVTCVAMCRCVVVHVVM